VSFSGIDLNKDFDFASMKYQQEHCYAVFDSYSCLAKFIRSIPENSDLPGYKPVTIRSNLTEIDSLTEAATVIRMWIYQLTNERQTSIVLVMK